MASEVLVIGGSKAGLQAALDLADAGLSVHLIEASPFFNRDTETLPPHEFLVRQLEILKHPNIRVRTNAMPSRVQEADNGFQVSLVQHPRYIDLERCTACGDCIAACPVTLPDSGRKAIYLEGQPGCAAIEKAGKAPCAYTCPAGIHVQGYVALIAQQRYREAIDLIHQAMPFASVCGRVCNHYCESECTRGKVDEPVNIMALKRFVADWEYSHRKGRKFKPIKTAEISVSSGKHVAIIGSGPAGLTAARDLVRRGHRVTVFEALPVAGGMMRVGIPAHRLPNELLDWEINRILDEGVDLKLNTRIDDVSGLLQDGFDAVLIATGAHVAKKIPIPNADHPDNWLSLDVLRRASLGENFDLNGKRVVVLGGGNVALDSARTALRLGAAEVCMACLEPRGEMPGFEWEILVAEEEGIRVCPGRTFKEIVVEKNRITGVRCMEVVFRGFKKGRPDIDEIVRTEHVLPADIVIWAVGQAADLTFLPKDGSVRTRKGAGIKSDSELMTTLPGVFVAGDVHRGVTFFVVDAIGEGHQSATSIDRYLRGETSPDEETKPEKVVYRKKEIRNRLSQVSAQERVQISSIPLEERVCNFREVDLPLTEEQALSEAQRCLVCGPCSECQACVEACKAGAISHDQQGSNANLFVGAIIYAERKKDPIITELTDSPTFHQVAPEDAVSASAAAAQILASSAERSRSGPVTLKSVPPKENTRIGTFICACGEHISSIIDIESVRNKLAAMPEVIHSQILPFSCTQEAAETIQRAEEEHQLNRVVLAACACCSSDQVCYSCTYQRVRSRKNLGVLLPEGARISGITDVGYVFVNIREQCAWAHAKDPKKATSKAIRLISAAVTQAWEGTVGPESEFQIERSVLVVGKGAAASVSRRYLKKQGIQTQRVNGLPAQVKRTRGKYLASRGDQTWSGEALIMAPGNQAEAERITDAFGNDGLRPRVQENWGGLNTHRPGIFYCEPDLDPDLAGSAAAARAAAWLGRKNTQPKNVAIVEPARCRSCGTCVEICEFGAPEVIGLVPNSAVWIDPVVCVGCGTCSAHCPSGAIGMSNTEDAMLARAVSMLLSPGD